jgi:AcrR family transcriptional regulator
MNSRTKEPARAARAGRTAKSEQTRSRILDTALALFNERGTAAVSTNHVAAQAGLSPGNLYYHFADKQEIIRALHDRYAAANEGLWEPVPGTPANLARLRAGLSRGMELAWEYRFFERELLALLRADPQLQARYRQVHERRLGQWRAFGEQLAAQGALRPQQPPATITDLATAIWLIGASWLPFLEITGDPRDPRQVAQGADLVLAVLAPYLTGREDTRTGRESTQTQGNATRTRRENAGRERS